MRIALKRLILDTPIIVGAVLLGAWLTRESVPVEFTGIYFVGAPSNNSEEPTHVEFIQPGKTAVFRMVGEKYRNCPALIAEEIVDSDGDVFRLPARVGGITRAGPFDEFIEVPISDDASPGRAVFRQRASYGIDIMEGCFRPYIVGPPDRPSASFCIGTSPCRWGRQ